MIVQLATATRDGLRTAARSAVDFLTPPSCPVTGDRLQNPVGLGASAWRDIHFIDAPICDHCGAPFAVDYGPGVLCPSCIAEPPGFDRARAAFVYDDASRSLVVGFKHYDRTERAALLSHWLARAGLSLLNGATPVMTPIPLHWRKRMFRMYNQAALLAVGAARRLNVRYESDWLVRIRATKQQHSLPSHRARQENVAGAFRVRASRLREVRDAHVILVDDVLTTGATLSAAAKTLKKAGAARVDALVLSRVVKGGVGAI